jgi:hypothetical protein
MNAMTGDARALLDAIRADIAGTGENPLVAAVAAGQAPLAAVAALAAEEWLIIPSDRRAFLTLAARSTDAAGIEFFAGLAQGESAVLPLLEPFAAAAGVDRAGLDAHTPLAGCQAYPSYVSWLALNAEPGAAALALAANFAAWGGYCAGLAGGLRDRYGFDDTACAFLDFFAGPVPDLDGQAVAAAQAALDRGDTLGRAGVYGRLLHDYETMFWRTLAGLT